MKKSVFIIFSQDNHEIIERSVKKMIKILDDVKKMGMCDLAHNCMFIKNREAWYRNFSEEIPLHDLMKMLIKHHVPKDSEIVEKMNDEELCEYITEIYGGYLDAWESIEFVLATFFHMAWGFAEVREELKEYEKEQIEQQERKLKIGELADYLIHDNQIDKAIEECIDETIEECAGLIQALSKLKNSEYDESKGISNPIFNGISKMADVRIMQKKLMYLLDCEGEVEEAILGKVERQLEKIQEEKEIKK